MVWVRHGVSPLNPTTVTARLSSIVSPAVPQRTSLIRDSEWVESERV